MLLSSISETTYYEKREKNGISVGFFWVVETVNKNPKNRVLETPPLRYIRRASGSGYHLGQPGRSKSPMGSRGGPFSVLA